MSKAAYLIGGCVILAIVGYALRGSISDALLTRDAFVDCFEDQFIVAMQSEGLQSGNNILTFSAESMFGARSRTLGNAIMDTIDREGATVVLGKETEKAGRLTIARLDHYNATKELQPPSMEEVVAEATVTCIKRGRPW